MNELDLTKIENIPETRTGIAYVYSTPCGLTTLLVRIDMTSEGWTYIASVRWTEGEFVDETQ
jgi:hypothetical protein